VHVGPALLHGEFDLGRWQSYLNLQREIRYLSVIAAE
jgi:hypothetical protein